MVNFVTGDQVKWFDSIGKGAHKIYSMVPNYGHICKLTPKHADVVDASTRQIVRVLKSELNFN